MPKFSHLRTTPWEPSFIWVESAKDAANRINIWHEDWPEHVGATYTAITRRFDPGPRGPSNETLLYIHRGIFASEPWAGFWRIVDVRVGPHTPPPPRDIPGLMEELEAAYPAITDIETLEAWYDDFETIHPFQDGNGRVGGGIVAAYSHAIHPDKGWLAPNQ